MQNKSTLRQGKILEVLSVIERRRQLCFVIIWGVKFPTGGYKIMSHITHFPLSVVSTGSMGISGFFVICHYRKIASSNTCRLFQIAYEGDFKSLCTVTF